MKARNWIQLVRIHFPEFFILFPLSANTLLYTSVNLSKSLEVEKTTLSLFLSEQTRKQILIINIRSWHMLYVSQSPLTMGWMWQVICLGPD